MFLIESWKLSNLLHWFFTTPVQDFPFLILKLFGFWLCDNWEYYTKFYYKFYMCCIQIIVMTVFIGQLLYVINEVNIESAVLSGALLIPSVANYFRQFNLFHNKKQISEIGNKIRDDKYIVIDNGARKIKNYYYNRLRFMNVSITTTIILFGLMHSYTSWRGNRFLMPIWAPQQIIIAIPYWVLFIYTMISFWVHLAIIMSYDLLLSGHLTQLAMHLDILKYRFTIISKLNKWRRRKYLITCIQHHTFIYELSNDVQNTFFVTNSVSICVACLCLCLGVYKFSTDSIYSIDSWVSLQFIIAVLFKWAIQCWEATIVMHKSIEISDAVYSLNWMNFDISTAKNVIIIIRRSIKRPIIFYGLFTTSLSNHTLRIASLTIRWIFCALCLILLPRNVISKTGLCEASTGQSIIVDIEESRGNVFDQSTVPEELSVSGNPYNETTLELTFPGKQPLFALDGKKLRLLEPLDRDGDNLSHVVFQLICTIRSSGKRRIIPVIVRISDINDNPPKFINTPYETTVPELTPVGSTIFQNVVAVDADAGVNGLVEYSIAPGDGNGIGSNNGVGRDRITTADGYGFFSINLPHQGQVTVNRTLDFERTQRYFVTILASDRARNVSERFTSTTTLTVNIRDDDDQDPSFIYQGCMLLDGACINPEYSASVSSGVLSGILNISPEKIQAVDMDSINAPIHYSFLSGSPANYRDFFEINPNTGAVKQIDAVGTTVTKKFDIIIKAVEVSEAKRSATAKLSITVKPVDSNPPVITATSVEGFVDENAPVGTKVIDKNGNPIKLTVSDADLGSEDPKPNYTFELTTSYFAIDSSGILVVNEETLDRDPPSPGRFRFQVIAREKTGVAASSPLSFVVTLNDVNDNAPQLPMVPPITVQAGEARPDVIKVEATDNDEGENAEITYSIYHVSNNGLQKFKIDPKSGVIESVRKLNAGEQYSITVQATDKGGKYSQTIVEVNVIPGPNTRSPIFQQPVYEVQVSEGASINSTVATITALDPENDPVSYAIVSGNDLRQFAIGDKSGIITVIRKLDREDLTRYQLLIKAEDSGGLSSTATVNIRVTDINDKNPEFEDLPYEFEVKEGEARKLIGRVHADDADEGINAVVRYFAPDDIPFTVDPETGDVLTKIALDYEQNHEYKFVVTARDGAPDHRLATATVTVKVIDVEDEIPIFHQSSYETKVKENVPDYMVIQVVADDPDTKKQITYMIKQGDTDLFSIDPKTGVIKTIRGLDYERDSQHILIIGTLENTSDLAGSTTRVVINVQDMNDIPPVFTSVPLPITLDDDVPIGTTVINLLAQDSDGTSPGNQVRYEIIGRGIANKYFVIDPDSGILTVRDDLRKETDSEYQVDVRAYDLGEPQLSSVTTVPIYVRHVATVAPEIGLGFAEDSYNVDVPENASDNTLIKIITIINSHNHDSIPLKCEIYSGNNDGLFEANITEERNCALKLKKGILDYETVEFYQIKIKLESLSGLLNSHRNSTMVKIQVIDVNDNKPEFIFPEDPLGLRKRRYFAAIPRNIQFSPSDSHVLQLKAHDKDNGKFGKLEYKILDGRGTQYFTIDSSSGIINTVGTFDNVLDEELPFKFNVQVRDNPNSVKAFNTAEAPIIVNLISEENLLILVIQDATHDVVQKDKIKIMRVLEERTGLLIGIEKIAVRKTVTKNGTVENHSQDSDVWFYTVDPKTEIILDRNSSQLQRIIFDKSAMSAIMYEISTVVRVNAIDIHAPVTAPEPVRTQTAVSLSVDVYPYALIIVACIILVLGIAGIIYICISWSRYKAYKDRMQRMYVVPRYDPVFVETDLKEYETQVLRMSVPNDDNDSYNDLQLDFSNKNHAFSLDNVSYITKDHNGSTGQQSPVSSEAATTVRASSIAGNHPEANIQSLRRSTLGRKNTNNTINTIDTPVLNPLFNHTDLLSASPSNDNVTFRERKDYSHLGFTYLGEQSPVETTTEL